MAAWEFARHTRSLTTQSALLIAGRLAGFAFALAIPIVLVRVLDQDAFGTYKQFVLVASLLVMVLPMGLDASLFFLIPQDPQRAGNYFWQTFLALMSLGIVVGTVLWWGRSALAELLNSPLLASIAPLLALFVLFELAGRLLEQVVVIEGQARLAALVLAGSDIVKAAAIVGPALLTGRLYWVAVGAAGFAAARCLAVVGWALWQYRHRMEGRRAIRVREQWTHALPLGSGGLLQAALYRFHSFYVAGAFAPTQFAIYAVGGQQIPPVQIFFRSLFEVTLVRMTEYFGQGRTDAMRDLWRKLIAKQAIVIVPLVIAMGVLAEPFVVGLFTERFADAVPVFRVSLGLIALTMFNDHAVLRAVGCTGFIFAATVAALGATLVLVPALTAVFGLPGAMLGFVLSVALLKGLGLAKLSRLLHVPMRDVVPLQRLARYAAASAIAAVLILPTLTWVDPPLLQFVVSGGLFWSVYLVVGWVGQLFPLEDRQEVARLWRSTRARRGLVWP